MLVRCRGVRDVQDEIRGQRLFEGGSEAFHELVRKAPDEADRVGDEVATALVGEASCGRVQSLEEPVVDGHRGIGQRVQKRGLASVRIPRERDDRSLPAAACLSLRVASALELLEPAPELADAPPCEPAVRLELRLAGTACPDAAAEALEMLPHAAHPRQVVLELRQLDLQLAFGARRMLGEDVEDELRAV